MAVYAFLLALVQVANVLGPERWWWSGLNLFLPQWIWALPGLAVLALFVTTRPRLAWLPLLGLAWALGPIMGLQWHPLAGRAIPGTKRFRVMTYNIKWGRRDTRAALDAIREANPDVLLLQDAYQFNQGALHAMLPGFSIFAVDQYVFATRLPLLGVTHEMEAVEGAGGGTFRYLRGRVRVGNQAVTIYNVHLITPREGLNSVRWGWEEGIPAFQDNVDLRLREAVVLKRRLRQEEGPVLLAGDLNAPMPSVVCKGFERAGLEDAFSSVGNGYGYTYGHYVRLRHSYLRIDHVFTSPHLTPVSCWTGPPEGSDHRPVIADIAVRQNWQAVDSITTETQRAQRGTEKGGKR
ncbi:MAG TPA: endonuclease/exonuclease/phosphatase family protein [Armatimonadota bacterium]|jgi:endonuclease/exonuclease/phosphatase (EEP) superfamily protein YafD